MNQEEHAILKLKSNLNVKSKTTMLKLGLCDYSNAYILAKGKIILEQELMQLLDKQIKEIKV